MYTWAIADIHGEYKKLEALLANMAKSGFDLNDPEQKLVQLGDRNDRGPDSYKVNDWFRTAQMMYPGQVVVLLGNHDQMMIDAADGRSDLMYYNGGTETARSYVRAALNDIPGNPRNYFSQALKSTGHYDWLKSLPLFHETPEYFFSHAPIPLEKFRRLPPGFDFRCDKDTLIWSFVNLPEERWVDPNLVPIEEEGNFYGKHKICVYGHIHGMYMRPDGIVIPDVRAHGNAVLLDTGAGCHKDGRISAIRLPDKLVVDSSGRTYQLGAEK